MVLGQYRALLVDICVSMEQNWLIHDGIGSVEGCTGCYLVAQGQYNLVLLGIRWYWVSIGLLCLHILKKIPVIYLVL